MRLGFIGLGVMGRTMTEYLLAAGAQQLNALITPGWGCEDTARLPKVPEAPAPGPAEGAP